MSREEAGTFKTRELIVKVLNTQEEQGKLLAAINANMITGKEKMDEHGKDIKSLTAWLNGIKAGISLIGTSLGIHIFKQGGL